LHFNHTERTEMFYFNYTNSSTNAEVSSNLLTSAATSDDSNSMGDLYMNNVTRHMTLKLDNKRPDALTFTLIREECITVGGCNPKLPDDGTIETEFRYWSNASHWNDDRSPGGVKPTDGDEVVIPSTWNMVMDDLDAANHVFKYIEINGRLSFPNNTKSYTLKSYLVYVRKGELIVGYEDKPVEGKITFELYGNRSQKDIYFHDKMFEGGNKVIANTGKLRMYGKPVETRWTRLADVAPAGQSWIVVVDDPTDWSAGDQIGIVPSGRDYTQRDAATIASINGKNITLTSALLYEHYGKDTHNSSATGGIDIRAEVLHLTRSIVVKGTNEDGWGGHVVTSHNDDTGFVNGALVSVERHGHAIIDHVEFNNCSQYDTDKASVRFVNIKNLTSTDTRSSVTNCSIHDGLGIGIMVSSAQDIVVDNNVVWFQHIGGIWMKNSPNTTITNNVAGGFGTRYWSGMTLLDELAIFDLCNKDQNCTDLTVQNNIAAGAERIGFLLPATSCDDTTSYSNNLAHTVQHGAWILFNNLINGCQGFNGFKAYKTIEEGVLTYQGYKNLQVNDIETLDCGIGATLLIGGTFETNTIKFNNSIIWGETDLLPADTGSFCINVIGIWLPGATNMGKVVPETKPSNLPYHKIKSYANWYTEAWGNGLTFKNWKSGERSCDSSKRQRVFAINDDASDHVPVMTLQDTIFDNVNNTAMAYLFDPPQAWANIDD